LITEGSPAFPNDAWAFELTAAALPLLRFRQRDVTFVTLKQCIGSILPMDAHVHRFIDIQTFNYQ
jgi:hypothetical protein